MFEINIVIGVITKDTNNIREEIIKFALLQIHKPYVHGMHGPNSFDCAGFVWYVYNEILGINIYDNGVGCSTTTKIMTSDYGKITYFNEFVLDKNIKLINPGDILLFHTQSKKEFVPKEDNRYPGHCGIYIGDGRFIHCTRLNNHNQVIKTNFEISKHLYEILVGSKDIISDEKVLKKTK